MKNILYSFIVLIVISACEIIDYDYNSYTIKNETEHTVNIMAYDKYYNNGVDPVAVERELVKFSDNITIEPYDKYYVEKGTGEDPDPQGVFTRGENVDSVIITFNNNRKITYVCNKLWAYSCNEERSIINWHLYEFENVENRGIDYTYTLTEEDYNNAELIE